MHLYEDNRTSAQCLVDERYQRRVEMPEMPIGDPWSSINNVLAAEVRIRAGEVFDSNLSGLDPYWSDLIRMLQVFFSRDDEKIEALMDSMSFQRYRPYLSQRIGRGHSV